MCAVAQKPILCVDVGGTSTKAGLLDSLGQIRFVQSIPTKPCNESYLESLIGLIDNVRDNSMREFGERPSDMGVAIAGFLDPERNYLFYNSNLAWLEGFPLRERLHAHFPEFSVELEVDSNAATMAEHQFGSGRGSKRFLCVTCGTGLGVGMAIDGIPLRFAYGCLGDMGHVVVLRDGPACTCGGKGCAEIMISAPVLAEEYKKRSGKQGEITLRDVIREADAGEAEALSVLRRAGEWLGVAIASMANIFFPDHIAVAGGLSAGGDCVLKPAERIFRQTACTFARQNTTFAPATLGSMATLIGAAWPFWKGRVH